MATIDTGYLPTIAGDNQRLIDVAKNLWEFTSQIQDPSARSRPEEQIKRIIDISEDISSSLDRAG